MGGGGGGGGGGRGGGGGGGGCDALPLTRSNIKNLYPFKIRVKAKGEESNSGRKGLASW